MKKDTILQLLSKNISGQLSVAEQNELQMLLGKEIGIYNAHKLLLHVKGDPDSETMNQLVTQLKPATPNEREKQNAAVPHNHTSLFDQLFQFNHFFGLNFLPGLYKFSKSRC